MQFVGSKQRIHTLDAKEAVKTGLDMRRLVLTAFRYAVNELTEYPEDSRVLQGEERQRMLEFFRWVEGQLRAEIFK